MTSVRPQQQPWSSVSWESARELLGRYADPDVDFLPDRIVEALHPSCSVDEWLPISGFSEDDDAIWAAIAALLPAPPPEPVILVTDSSFVEGEGPLRLTLADMPLLAREFVSEFNDTVFGGDAIILGPSSLILVHHEGLLGVVAAPV